MAVIFCFTSTGNSLYTAGRIAEQIGGEVLPMNCVSLADQAECGDDMIGFVFPVYFWGLPRMVERFVMEMRIKNEDAYIFSVATYGGNGQGVHGRLGSLLKQKGARLSYGVNLKSPSNYLPNHEAKDSEEFRKEIEENLSGIVESIKGRSTNRIKAFTFIDKLGYGLCPDENSDREFSVAPSCTGCMVCEKICPAGNIEMKEGKPVFLHKCEHCLACLQNCPACAVDWKNKTQGKKRYRHFAVTVDDLIAFNSGRPTWNTGRHTDV